MSPHQLRAPEASDLRVLMAAYQQGDLAAFDGLYGRLAPILRRYLLGLSRDPAWTDDLVQETFLQLHRSRRTYGPGRPVEPWAFAIARHVFLMGRRGRRRKGEFVQDPLGDADGPVSRAHDEALAAREQVVHGFAALSPGTRRAVWLHHVLGWSFDEVGARLGIRGAAAKLRASRGMSTLRRAVGGRHGFDRD